MNDRVSGCELFPVEWQPIETAPKDGSQILVIVGERIFLSEWRDTERREFGTVVSSTQGWVRPSWWFMGDFEPTLWFAIPAMPAKQEVADGDLAVD